MTGAPATIRATRTATPPAVDDALVLVSHLSWTIEQIMLRAPLEQGPFNALADALRLSSECGRLVRQAKGAGQ